MNFTQALTQQQAVIDVARARYREYQDKLNHLMEQVKVIDPWNLSEFAKLNQEIGAAARDSDIAWADWCVAIDGIADISTSEEVLPQGQVKGASYLEAKGYRSEGDRTVWEPTDPTDLEEFYQDNDEPDLYGSEQEETNLIVGSSEITFEMPDGRVEVHYFVADEF